MSVPREALATIKVFRSSTLPTVENRVGGITQNLIYEFITKSLANVGGGPEQADWNATLEYSVCTWTNTGTSGNENHTAEQGDTSEDTVGGNTTNPELGRWVLNDVRSPVTSTRNNEGKFVPLGLGDGGEGVPFLEGRMGNPDGRASAGAGYRT